MGYLIDTDVAIFMRDRHPDVLDAITRIGSRPFLSVVTQVELEGGVYARPELAGRCRRAVDAFLANLTILPFDTDAVAAYRHIVITAGYSRRKIADRMVAATALVHDLTLITMNGRDFADIPGLGLEVWPSPRD